MAPKFLERLDRAGLIGSDVRCSDRLQLLRPFSGTSTPRHLRLAAGPQLRSPPGAGRPVDRMGRISRHTALAVHPQHLGRGLARQHRTFHLDAGRASSTHAGGAANVETQRWPLPSVFHGLVAVVCQLADAAPTGYTEFAGASVAFSGQCSRSHLARGALTPWARCGRPPAPRQSGAPPGGGHRRGTLGVVHRGALRREFDTARYAQPGGLRHRGATMVLILDIYAPRPPSRWPC